MSDVGSIIAAGANLVGNVMTNQINAERASSDMATYLNLVKKQRDWQKEDYDWTEGYSKRMLDYQNAYNSPSAQIQRYREAGLNPFLMMQNGQVGSGNSQSVPNAPLPSRTGVTSFQRPELGNPMEGVADKLYGASQLKSQRLVALSEMAKSIPSLVKGIGSEPAKRLLSSMFGKDVSTRLIDSYINNELLSQQINNERNSLELSLREQFGVEKESLILNNLREETNKLQEEILSLRKGRDLTDAEINELFTRSAKNLAEAAHLRADTETIDKLRDAIYYQAKWNADSAHSQSQIDSYNAQDRRSKFISEQPERDAQLIQGSPDSELTPSQKIYKKAALFWKRLGKVVKSVSPLSP